ncbi:MAG: DUF4968 domain-containing protein [Prevotellaceae bacterium]|nr:DUF4968 domain-containing protein [Prevotellaceae bacterium]
MKRATALAILAASATLCLAQGTGLSADDPAGQYRCEVQFYTPSIVRIVKYPSSLGQMPAKQSFRVVAQPEASVKLRFSEDEGEAVAASPVLSVSFDKLSGNLSFSSKDGNLLPTEAGAELEQRQEGADKGAWRVKQSFAVPPDEALYGLGQLQNGLMSQRGFSKYLMQDNTDDALSRHRCPEGDIPLRQEGRARLRRHSRSHARRGSTVSLSSYVQEAYCPLAPTCSTPQRSLGTSLS